MEDFVPFEIAKKLREKGFNEKTFGFYLFPIKLPQYPITYITKNYNKKDNFYSAPTISQVLKWLREEKNIVIMIDLWLAGYSAQIYIEISEWNDGFDWKDYYNDFDCYKTYEQAALAGLKYCLDNLI